MRKDGTRNGTEGERQKRGKGQKASKRTKGTGIWTEMEKEAAGKEEERQKEGEAAGERKKNTGWGQARDCKTSLGWAARWRGNKKEQGQGAGQSDRQEQCQRGRDTKGR